MPSENTSPADAAADDPGISLILNSEDSAPFDLEPLLQPLGITKELFRKQYGGTAE